MGKRGKLSLLQSLVSIAMKGGGLGTQDTASVDETGEVVMEDRKESKDLLPDSWSDVATGFPGRERL